MDERLKRQMLRRRFNPVGWALFIYYIIMNTAVFTVTLMDTAIRGFFGSMRGDGNALLENAGLSSMGWGYVLACAIGFGALLMWKGKDYLNQEILAQGRPMKVKTLGFCLCLLAACQVLLQLLVVYQEWILHPLGLSMQETMEASAVNADSLSMFLYACLLAPVTEELLFRGVILRTLLPCGKKFSIVASAFLFGMFHGNLVQAPFAFCVGLILGYVAVEYSAVWAMVLHMFNNLVLGDMLPRVLSLLPELLGNLLLGSAIIGMCLLAAAIAVWKRKTIARIWRENPMDGRTALCFFTAPGVVTITAIMWLNMAAVLLLSAR